ncbi:XylR N-terminal domain-containing protein [Haloarcula halophila]|uniref:XylR N-terminal domain-containing protein n=1 Tax=Haloarcula TaxID=2237 RepID=UPI0023E4701C|nr:XylR N-terminal domain-containing protein [Halomicroarcula sp. DFY41]
MQASDFQLEADLEYGTRDGVNAFKNNRMVTFNADAIGLLRQQLIDAVGVDTARDLLLRFGFQSGLADFLQMKTAYDFETPDDLLEVGPALHTQEGIVAVEPVEMEYDRAEGHFYFNGLWHNSYEAEQHVIHNGESDHPVCWSLMGYGSAWCSGFMGEPVLELETRCVGMGDDVCEWVIKPIDEWGPDAEPYIAALEDLYAEV